MSNDVVCRVSSGRKYEEIGMKKYFRESVGELRLLGSFSVGYYIPWLYWVNRINGLDAQAERVAKAFDEFPDGVVDQHMEDQYTLRSKERTKRTLWMFCLRFKRSPKRPVFPLIEITSKLLSW